MYDYCCCHGCVDFFSIPVNPFHIPILSIFHFRSHAVTSDIDIAETARAAQFFCSDALIVTGKETGMAADLSDIDRVCTSVNLQVIVGSGVTTENVGSYVSNVDAMIIGSHFKREGKWYNDVDKQRVEQFMDAWTSATTVC